MVYIPRRSSCLLLILLILAIEDSHAQSFILTGNMMRPRLGHSATLLQDGRVLVAGGYNPRDFEEAVGQNFTPHATSAAEIYDPATGTFSETGAMSAARAWHAALLLQDGRVLLVGGDCFWYCIPGAEFYDSATGTFTSAGNMSAAQSINSAILLTNGKALVNGTATIELFDPATGVFTPLKSAQNYGVAMSLLSDGEVLLTSSLGLSLYDPANNGFRQLPIDWHISGPTATPLLDGSIFLAGGYTDLYGFDATVYTYVYDPATQTLRTTPNMAVPRDAHTATLLKDSRVLIAGGYDGGRPLAAAELYDPTTGTLSRTGDMVMYRDGHAATLLRDGRVLITGGRASSSPVQFTSPNDSSAELFIPESTQGSVPRVELDSTRYCVGDTWTLRADSIAPRTSVQISGTRDGIPWTIRDWQTSGPDGTLVATGTYGADAVGNYTLWLYAGGKVSNSVPVRIETCPETVMTIPAGGAGSMVSSGRAPQVRAGYASASINAGPTSYGTAVISLMENGATVSEAGLPALGLMTTARLFIDFRNNVSAGSSGPVNVNTGIALVNPGFSPATISLRLLSVSGQVIATGSGSLNGGRHLSLFVNEMQTFAPDFVVPADFPDSVRFASLEVSSTMPISVVGLRIIANQRGETLMTSTPVADLSLAPSTATLVVPQFVDGGGFTNTLILLNTSASTESGNIRFRDDTGTVVPMTLNGVRDSAFPYEIPADGAAVFETDGSDATVKIGWLEVVPAEGTTTPVGSGMFRFVENGIDATESAEPASQPGTHMRIYIDTSNGHDTAISFANPGNTDLTINILMVSTDGVPVAGSQATLTLPALGHISRFIGELMTWDAGLKGVAEISSSGPLAALTLRTLRNQHGDILLTSLPVADLSQPAPVPIFPQIADGGGFQTEIICISPGTVPVSATLQERFN